jgi:hypothetical protein
MQCRRTGEQRDELAAFQSITSSARASSVGGTLEAKRLSGLEIDDKLEATRPLDWQILRPRTIEYLPTSAPACT